MALAQPSIVTPVPAVISRMTPPYDLEIRYSYGTGSTTIANRTILYFYENIGDAQPALTHEQVLGSTIQNIHTITAIEIADYLADGTLKVETKYYITLQLGTNNSSEVSPLSAYREIWVLNPPTLSITQPSSDVTIDVSTLTVQATYNTGITGTNVNANNDINTYIFELKQGNDVVLSSGTLLGSSATPTPNTQEFTLSYTFTNIPTNTNAYTMTLTVVSAQNITTTASRSVSVLVEQLGFNTARVTNNICDGYITIECNITNIEGELTGGGSHHGSTETMTGWIDLTTNAPQANINWDTGYTFPSTSSGSSTYSNWTMRLWGFHLLPVANTSPFYNATTGATQASENNINPSTTNQYLLQFRNVEGVEETTYQTLLGGEIDIYIVGTNYSNGKPAQIHAEMYVYPFATTKGYGYSKYYQSGSLAFPSDPSTGIDPSTCDNIMIWVRSLNGEYEIQIEKIGKGGN